VGREINLSARVASLQRFQLASGQLASLAPISICSLWTNWNHFSAAKTLQLAKLRFSLGNLKNLPKIFPKLPKIFPKLPKIFPKLPKICPKLAKIAPQNCSQKTAQNWRSLSPISPFVWPSEGAHQSPFYEYSKLYSMAFCWRGSRPKLATE